MLHLLSNRLYKAQGLLTLGFINNMDCYDASENQRGLLLFLFFCCFRNELHAIVDEVYMLTVFEESVTFCSVLSIDRCLVCVGRGGGPSA